MYPWNGWSSAVHWIHSIPCSTQELVRAEKSHMILMGFEPMTFQPSVWSINHYAMGGGWLQTVLTELAKCKRRRVLSNVNLRQMCTCCIYYLIRAILFNATDVWHDGFTICAHYHLPSMHCAWCFQCVKANRYHICVSSTKNTALALFSSPCNQLLYIYMRTVLHQYYKTLHNVHQWLKLTMAG